MVRKHHKRKNLGRKNDGSHHHCSICNTFVSNIRRHESTSKHRNNLQNKEYCVNISSLGCILPPHNNGNVINNIYERNIDQPSEQNAIVLENQNNTENVVTDENLVYNQSCKIVHVFWSNQMYMS